MKAEVTCPDCGKKHTFETPAQVRGKTLKFQDIENFFRNDIAPVFIKRRGELAKSEALLDQKKGNKEMLLYIAVIIIAGSVAYAIISGVGNQQGLNTDLTNTKVALAACQASGGHVVNLPTTNTTTKSILGIGIS